MSRLLGPALILIIALTLPSLLAAQLPEPRFADEVDVEVVNLDVVTIGEDGMPMSGLTANDFEVLDDGQRPSKTGTLIALRPMPSTQTSATAAARSPLRRALSL